MDINKFIIDLEISSLLHDIGKLSHEFILSKDPDSPIKDSHAVLILKDPFPPNLRKFLFTPLKEKFSGIDLISDGIAPIHFICAHHGCERCKLKEKCRTFDKNPFIKLLQIADRFDSSNPPNSGKQEFNETFLSDFFLKEKRVDYVRLSYLRIRLEKFVDLFFKELKRDKIIWGLKLFLKEGISDTRRGANDIDLFSHSYAVSSIFKALLFDYLYFGYPFPETIFDVNLKFLKTGRKEKRRIEEEIAFGNEIFSIEDTSFFLIGQGIDKLFLKLHSIEGEIVNEVFVKKTEKIYPHPLKPDEILSTVLVKTPQDTGMTFEEMVNGVKEIIDFGRYKELEKLKIREKGLRKHIKNLRKGNKSEEEKLKLKILRKVRSRINYLKRVVKGKANIKKIEKFLSLTLAPIRPPSINRFSEFLLSLMNKKKMNIREITLKLFLNKPVTISRIVKYGSDLKKVNSLEEITKFYGKIRFGRRYVKGKYLTVKGIKLEKEKAKIRFDDFDIEIPLFYNGKEVDRLNLYFFLKGKRNGNLSFYLGKGRSLVHITEIKEGDRIKIIRP
ncbi:MAG: hypothetical protein DRI28_02015 [Caldiserica bacterium]|nr:MAG: hypothetical protein DRI28_02015 [Caldisericota bacterium]